MSVCVCDGVRQFQRPEVVLAGNRTNGKICSFTCSFSFFLSPQSLMMNFFLRAFSL